MRYLVAAAIGAAVLATSVVSVRLHLHVAQLRYRLWAAEQEHARAERELQLARAELEAARAPRRLMERWSALRDAGGPAVPRPASGAAGGGEDGR